MVTKTNKKTVSNHQTKIENTFWDKDKQKDIHRHISHSCPKNQGEEKKILLMGNPNVGKSIIFSGLCKKQVDSANYAGTTVTVTQGKMELEQFSCVIIDVPGIYSFEANCEAEKIALKYLEQGADVILCVLDATNIEQGLRFAYQLLHYHIPIIYCLNLSDLARKQGISIDLKALSMLLKGPIVETIAVKGYGFTEIKKDILRIFSQKMLYFEDDLINNSLPFSEEQVDQKIDNFRNHHIIDNSSPKNIKTFQTKCSNAIVHPFWGIIIAIMILSTTIFIMIKGGEFLIQTFFLPLSELFISFFRNAVLHFELSPFLNELLIGEYGILITPFEWILASILPYVILFYFVFSFLEDSGYLPRISILFDNIAKKLGIQGGDFIPLLLGYGCAVPAILATRSSQKKKERIIVASIICFCIPCSSQTGAFVRLFAEQPIWFLPLLFFLSLIIIFPLSFILQKIIKGTPSPMVIELPNLILPNPKTYIKKIIFRFKHFLLDAEGPMMLSVLIIAFLSSSGLLDKVTSFLSPIMVDWLGLPKEAAVALIAGIIRREMSVAPLLALPLDSLQIFTGAVVSLFYLPCLSVFAVLTKEFGIKTAITIATTTILTALLLGGMIHFFGSIFLAAI